MRKYDNFVIIQGMIRALFLSAFFMTLFLWGVFFTVLSVMPEVIIIVYSGSLGLATILSLISFITAPIVRVDGRGIAELSPINKKERFCISWNEMQIGIRSNGYVIFLTDLVYDIDLSNKENRNHFISIDRTKKNVRLLIYYCSDNKLKEDLQIRYR